MIDNCVVIGRMTIDGHVIRDVRSEFTKGRIVLTASTKPESEAQIAEDFRQRSRAVADKLADIMTEASRHGMVVNVQFGRDGTGRSFVQNVEILKVL